MWGAGNKDRSFHESSRAETGRSGPHIDLGAVEDLIVEGIVALAVAFMADVPNHQRWRHSRSQHVLSPRAWAVSNGTPMTLLNGKSGSHGGITFMHSGTPLRAFPPSVTARSSIGRVEGLTSGVCRCPHQSATHSQILGCSSRARARA